MTIESLIFNIVYAFMCIGIPVCVCMHQMTMGEAFIVYALIIIAKQFGSFVENLQVIGDDEDGGQQ